MFKSPGDIFITLGCFDIHYYGIIMSLSIFLGLLTILFIRKRFFKEITADTVFDISFNLIIIGLICARLYYVIFDIPYFIKHPFEIIAIWNGGISIQGAIIGGIIGTIIYAKEHNYNFWKFADLFSFGLVTGQILGRWGNFFNSEAFGMPTNLPWKLYIPLANRPLEYKEFEYFHPTFLYESLLNIIIFLILYTILTKYKTKKNGVIFLSYIILYSIARITVETIRLDSVFSIGVIHIAHITSIILILISVFTLYKLHKNEI